MTGSDTDGVELFVLGGTDVGRSAHLEDGAWVGRAEGCGLRLGGRSISRRHARIERRGSDWVLVDQGSTNGLWLQDVRVDEVVLVDHGEFRVGDELMRARLGQAEPVEPPAAVAEPTPPVATSSPAAEPAIAFTSGGGAAPAVEDVEDDLELELEFDDEPQPATSAPAPAPTPEPRATVRDLQREELMASMAAKPSGLMSADLSQYPAWAKALIALVLVAFLALVAWGVSAVVLGVR